MTVASVFKLDSVAVATHPLFLVCGNNNNLPGVEAQGTLKTNPQMLAGVRLFASTR